MDKKTFGSDIKAGDVVMDIPLDEEMVKSKKNGKKFLIIGLVVLVVIGVVAAVLLLSGGTDDPEENGSYVTPGAEIEELDSHITDIQGNWHWVAYISDGVMTNLDEDQYRTTVMSIEADGFSLTIEDENAEGKIKFVEEAVEGGETYYLYDFDGVEAFYSVGDKMVALEIGGVQYFFERD